jgi:hypothetical protein
MMKARELAAKAGNSTYQKQPGEDVRSIAQGISGYKGRVHLHFGDPLIADFENADQVARAMDESVIGNYRLFASNCLAYRELHGAGADHLFADIDVDAKTRAEFERRKQACPRELLPFWLAQYANPVVARLAHDSARESAV